MYQVTQKAIIKIKFLSYFCDPLIVDIKMLSNVFHHTRNIPWYLLFMILALSDWPRFHPPCCVHLKGRIVSERGDNSFKMRWYLVAFGSDGGIWVGGLDVLTPLSLVRNGIFPLRVHRPSQGDAHWLPWEFLSPSYAQSRPAPFALPPFAHPKGAMRPRSGPVRCSNVSDGSAPSIKKESISIHVQMEAHPPNMHGDILIHLL